MTIARPPRLAGLAALAAALAVAVLLSIAVGARSIPLDRVWDLVWHGDGSEEAAIVHDLRLPRTLARAAGRRRARRWRAR